MAEARAQRALQKYDWYMRLDTDSWLLSEYPRDPFRFMTTHAKTYAFNILFMQAQPVFIRDLWPTVKDFVTTSRMQPASTLEAFMDRSHDYKCATFPRLTKVTRPRRLPLRSLL